MMVVKRDEGRHRSIAGARNDEVDEKTISTKTGDMGRKTKKKSMVKKTKQTTTTTTTTPPTTKKSTTKNSLDAPSLRHRRETFPVPNSNVATGGATTATTATTFSSFLPPISKPPVFSYSSLRSPELETSIDERATKDRRRFVNDDEDDSDGVIFPPIFRSREFEEDDDVSSGRRKRRSTEGSRGSNAERRSKNKSLLLAASSGLSSSLRDQIEDLRRRLDETLGENRVLKRIQARQARALGRFTDASDEIPRLVERYHADMAVLNEKVVRMKTKLERAEEGKKRAEEAAKELREKEGRAKERTNEGWRQSGGAAVSVSSFSPYARLGPVRSAPDDGDNDADESTRGKRVPDPTNDASVESTTSRGLASSAVSAVVIKTMFRRRARPNTGACGACGATESGVVSSEALKTEAELLRKKSSKLEEENGVLKRIHRQHVKLLERFEKAETDLPRLLKEYDTDVGTLREQLRRSRGKQIQTHQRLKDSEGEIRRLKTQLTATRVLARMPGKSGGTVDADKNDAGWKSDAGNLKTAAALIRRLVDEERLKDLVSDEHVIIEKVALEVHRAMGARRAPSRNDEDSSPGETDTPLNEGARQMARRSLAASEPEAAKEQQRQLVVALRENADMVAELKGGERVEE